MKCPFHYIRVTITHWGSPQGDHVPLPIGVTITDRFQRTTTLGFQSKVVSFSFIAQNGKLEIEGTDGIEHFEMKYETILEFSTGASHPPPAGFTSPPVISFHADDHYPHANTCSNTLYLPTKKPLPSCERFIYLMTYGILNSHGFGRV